MIYSRCLYIVMLCADGKKRAEYNITRSVLGRYIGHACQLLGCEVMKMATGMGYVLILVDVNPQVAITDFINKLKLWTSAWIVGNYGTSDADKSFWIKQCYFRVVSSHDWSKVSEALETLAQSYDADAIVKRCTMECCVNRSHSGMEQTATVCHHIILITSRSRLLLPLKYKRLLAQIITAAVNSLEAEAVACASMRNHVHALCRIPCEISAAEFISTLQIRLLKSMHTNTHFRRFEGWDDMAIIYTVADKRITEEEHDILNQDYIHMIRQQPNEMTPIYQKMRIPYITSLR